MSFFARLFELEVFDFANFSISAAEKGYLVLRLSVTTSTGHASMPEKESSIGILAGAIARYSIKLFLLMHAYISYLIICISLIILIIIILWQFIKHCKWWFGPPHQGHFDILTMMGRECSRLDPSYQRHITFASTGCYQVHPHHRLGIITPDLYPR